MFRECFQEVSFKWGRRGGISDYEYRPNFKKTPLIRRHSVVYKKKRLEDSKKEFQKDKPSYKSKGEVRGTLFDKKI